MLMRIFTLILFLFAVTTTNAQQVNLKISDKETLKPIPYAHVCVKQISNGNEKYKVTDKSGTVKLNIQKSVIIFISYVGYETITDTLTISDKTKEYKLKKTGFDIDEVIVTGTNKPIPVDKSIYKVKLIGKNQIERKGANNLADLLSDELNISLSHDPSTGTGMQLQGISGENVKILIDGVPVIGRMMGNIDLSQLDLSNVDHIEIIEGPMSVIYGSNALAGVINIITKDNKYSKFKAGLNTYYESIGTYNASGNMSFKKKKSIISLTGGRNFFSGFDTDTSTRRAEYKPKEQYNTGLNYFLNGKKLKLKYKADLFSERLLDKSNIISNPYSIKAYENWFQTLRANNNVQINQQLSEQSAYSLLASYSYYNRTRKKYLKDMTTLETQLTTGDSDHDTTTFDAVAARGTYNFNTKNKKINIQAGFDINLEYGVGKRMKNGKENIQDYAGFTGILWNLTPNFSVQPGLRASYNTKYNSPIVPSFNLKYVLKKFNFRASYARGFRAPSLKELYLYFYDSNHQIEGNEDLEAEYSHNYNVSTGYSFGTKKNKFGITLKSYYNQIENMITLVNADPENELHYTNKNIGQFSSLGGEANIQYKYLPFLKIDAGIARIGRTSVYDAENYIFSNNYNTKLTLNFLDNTASLSVFYKRIGEYPYYTFWDKLQLNYMDAYNNMDITANKKFFNNSIAVSLGVKNIFDNIEITGRQASSEENTTVTSLAGWGRTYFLGLKFNLTKY